MVVLRGYTFPEKGGGVDRRDHTRSTDGQPARDLLLFGNVPTRTRVYVGTAGVRFERNPNMRDQC